MEAAQTVEATANRITHKELTKDNRPFVLYQVVTDKGEFTTTKAELAEKVHREFLNKAADYSVKVVQKGEYTNYYLEGVSAISGQPQPSKAFPVPKQPDFVTESGPPPFIPETTATAPISEPEGVTAKDLMIFRQTATKVAAHLHRPGDPADSFWQDVDDLIFFFSTGQKPQEV